MGKFSLPKLVKHSVEANANKDFLKKCSGTNEAGKKDRNRDFVCQKTGGFVYNHAGYEFVHS